MTGRGPHDHDHPAGVDDCRGGNRDVGIDVGNRHGGARQKTGPGRRSRRDPARAVAHAPHVSTHLVVDDVRESRIERGEVARVREAVPLRPHRLVAGRAGVAGLDPGQPPDDPVGGLDQPVRGRVDLGRLIEDLERLREEPLGRDPPAISTEPGLAGRLGSLVDPVGLRLRGVMLPQLDPGMRIGAQMLNVAEGRAVALDRQHGAGREVDPDADHIRRIDACLAEQCRNRQFEHRQVIVGILQRPVVGETHLLVGQRQPLGDHPVGVPVNSRRDLSTRRDIHQDRPAGFGPEVDADRVLGHPVSPVRLGRRARSSRPLRLRLC